MTSAPQRGSSPSQHLSAPTRPIFGKLSEVLETIFPAQCPGCGQWDTAACDACLEAMGEPMEVAHFLPHLSRITPDGDDVPLFPVWALSSYEEMGAVIRAWKSRPNGMLDKLLGDRVDQLVRKAAGSFGEALDHATTIHVVPAPSRPARYRSDTYVAGTIADRVAGALATRSNGPDLVTSIDLFAPRKGRQRGRSRRDRHKRAPVRVRADLEGGQILLVDDVATTGATLEDCWQALHQRKHSILGALCIAAVIPRGTVP